MEAQKQGKLDIAITEFKKVTELQPDLAAGFVNLGVAYFQKRDFASAIPVLEQATKLNPDLAGAHQVLGTALLMQGDAASAIPHLEKARVADMLGIAYLEAGRFGDAIGTLGAALNQRPSDPDLLYYFGRATGLASKQSFDTLIASAPDSARTHQALAEQYTELRRVADAEKEYREAIRLRPDAPGVHLALGKVLAGGGNWAGAEVEFREEAKLRPAHAESAYHLGSALIQLGKAREALAALQSADKLAPNMPETLYALGKAAAMNGNTATAEASWKSLLSVENDSDLAAQAHFELAALYRKDGKTADAGREMQAYRKLKDGKK
jgi:tetratricopeptide (TPR) repeat protein